MCIIPHTKRIPNDRAMYFLEIFYNINQIILFYFFKNYNSQVQQLFKKICKRFRLKYDMITNLEIISTKFRLNTKKLEIKIKDAYLRKYF